jgi:hypothetical protein
MNAAHCFPETWCAPRPAFGATLVEPRRSGLGATSGVGTGGANTDRFPWDPRPACAQAGTALPSRWRRPYREDVNEDLARSLNESALRHPWRWAVACEAPAAVIAGLLTHSVLIGLGVAAVLIALGGWSVSRGPARRRMLKRLSQTPDSN